MVIPLNGGWCLPPMDGVDPGSSEGFLVGGTCACILLNGAGSCLFEGQSSSMFWGARGLGMALGSLSANGRFVFLFC